MADGKDIDYKPILYCGGSLVVGLVIGMVICNSKPYKKWAAKRAADKAKKESAKKA